MGYKKIRILLPIFISAALLVCGCATIQEPANEGGEAGDKDSKIGSLQEIIDDQQRQLRELNDRLNECESGASAGEKKTAAAGN
jgi:hypothetical protein